MTNTLISRFDSIMARVDAWADENAGWDCRGEAVAEVEFCLTEADCSALTDDEIFETACAAWMMAE
jgi:hypothetical protein